MSPLSYTSSGSPIDDRDVSAVLVVTLMGFPTTLLAALIGEVGGNNIITNLVYALLIYLSIPIQWGALGILVRRIINIAKSNKQ